MKTASLHQKVILDEAKLVYLFFLYQRLYASETDVRLMKKIEFELLIVWFGLFYFSWYVQMFFSLR